MNVNKPCYTIIGGVNGSGKSTFTGATKNTDAWLGIIINVDKAMLNGKMTPLEAGKLAIERIEHCLENNIPFTQEATLAGKRIVQTAKRAKEKGFFVRLNYIAVESAKEAKIRIAERVRKRGHNINDEDVDRRYSNMNHDIIEILPYCDAANFYDNQNGFELVGECRNGEIVQVGEYVPKWFESLKLYANDLKIQAAHSRENNSGKKNKTASLPKG